MIFIDSNVPMYLVGSPHRFKTEAQILVERSVAAGERMVTDAAVLQEILHGYTAINRRDAIAAALEAVRGFVDAEILQNPAALSARDALHLASWSVTASLAS